jgi:hypothetical protein
LREERGKERGKREEKRERALTYTWADALLASAAENNHPSLLLLVRLATMIFAIFLARRALARTSTAIYGGKRCRV